MKPIVFAAAFLLALPAFASDRDHDAVLQAVRTGEIKPLAEIMEIVRPNLQGDIVKVEVEREKGSWVYEFRIIGPDGRRSDVYVDARTANILRTRQK